MNATIDETITRVEELFTMLVGKAPSTTSRVPIPPEAEPVAHVEEQLGRLMSLVEQIAPRATTEMVMWRPLAWLAREESGGVAIAIDVPGVAASDVQIRVTPNAIVVSGRRARPQGVACSEMLFGAFSRTFPLNARVASEQVSARLQDGVLTICVYGEGERAGDSEIPIMS